MVATLSIVEGTQPSRLLDSAGRQDEKAAAVATQTAALQSGLDALRAAWQGDERAP